MAGRGQSAKRASSRSAARLAAVQALYQMDMTGIDLERGDRRVRGASLGQGDRGVRILRCRGGLFPRPRRGCGARAAQDRSSDRQTARRRMASHPRGLRSSAPSSAPGAYEILSRDDVPARVAISEYVDIAHAFFADEEPKVVNGILDRLGHRERPREFAAEGRDDG